MNLEAVFKPSLSDGLGNGKRQLGARSAPFLCVCEYLTVRFPEKKCILCVNGYMRIVSCRAYICFLGENELFADAYREAAP